MNHTATIRWSNTDPAAFAKGHYSRAHNWHFDGGAFVPASSSPSVVRLPFSDPAGVDPEEAFIASVASCHMLWFLDLARHAGMVVASYDDAAEASMAKTADGQYWIDRVTLRPLVTFAGDATDAAAVMAVHDAAHHACFIANSIRSEVVVEPRDA